MGRLNIRVKEKPSGIEPISIYYSDVISYFNESNGDDVSTIVYEAYLDSTTPTSTVIKQRRDVLLIFGQTAAQNKVVIDNNGGKNSDKIFIFIPSYIPLTELYFTIKPDYNKSISDGTELGLGGIVSSLSNADYSATNQAEVYYDISDGTSDIKGFSVLPFGLALVENSLCHGETEIRCTVRIENKDISFPLHKFLYDTATIDPSPISTTGYIKTKLEADLIC